MAEILGNNLKGFFDVIDKRQKDAEIKYANGDYEVWEVSDDLFKRMCDMSEDDFVDLAGEDVWWRSAERSNLGIPDTKFTVNGKKLLGWNWQDKKIRKYENLSEYLCECIGASTGKNVCACAVDLAKYNHMTMAELFEMYEGKANESIN